MVRGRDHHEWGFLTEEGWKHWESYVSARSAFGESGFEAWESGPVSPEVWLSTHSFLHPLWEDTEDPVLVGQVLLDDEDLAWVVLRVDLAMRGRYEVPTVRLGDPFSEPIADDDLVLVGECAISKDRDKPGLIQVPSGWRRFDSWGALTKHLESVL